MAEKCSESAVRDVRKNTVEKESIGVWVRKCLAELVHFEALVANTLLIGFYTFNGKEPVTLVQPAAVKLVVGDDKEKNDSDENLLELNF